MDRLGTASFSRVLAEQFHKVPPEQGREATEVIEQVAREILPLAARLDHPRFFGFVPVSPTWPSVLADFMAAAWTVNQCTWLTASGPSQIELTVIDWIRQWLGCPDGAGGLFRERRFGGRRSRASCRAGGGGRAPPARSST